MAYKCKLYSQNSKRLALFLSAWEQTLLFMYCIKFFFCLHLPRSNTFFILVKIEKYNTYISKCLLYSILFVTFLQFRVPSSTTIGFGPTTCLVRRCFLTNFNNCKRFYGGCFINFFAIILTLLGPQAIEYPRNVENCQKQCLIYISISSYRSSMNHCLFWKST